MARRWPRPPTPPCAPSSRASCAISPPSSGRSASEGERRAADWIAARLRRARLRGARRGGARPRDVLVAAGAAVRAAGGAGPERAPRGRALAAGAFAGAAIADDITGGRQWFRRRLLPSRPTWNVVAEAGDAGAERTVVVVAHHDAAHTSRALLAPRPSAFVGERFPGLLERTDTTPPLMWPVIGGPLLVAAGRARGRPRACARPARCWRSARRLPSPRSAARGVVPGRQRQPHRRGHAGRRSRGAWRERARDAACACCWSRPAARSRSWRACRPSPGATSPRCPPTARTSSASTPSARPSS